MSTPLPPQKPQTLLNTITQVVQTLHAKVNFSRLILKPNAKVPELIVHQADTNKAEVYPLLGDRYVVGRSSRTCDIVVRNPLVSTIHVSVVRDPKRMGLFSARTGFMIQDEDSTNGLYWGRRRIKVLPLRHGDSFTLGPPELASVSRVEYRNPPPWYLQTLRYGFYGICGLTAAVGIVVLFESQKFEVDPLPKTVTGPVIIHAADGRPLREANTIAHLEADQLSDFGPYLPKAVVASEDARFYWHLGIDPFGTLRALLTNVRDGEIREGGSTLSQQLARSLYRDYVGTEDSAGRKFREAVVALKLEAVYGKNKLLKTYLNRVYLGINLYGFEDAAKFYFNKSAKDLNLSEAATLVGILPAPNSFNPIQNYQLAVQYRDRVISRMLELGMVSEDEADRARRSRIEINPKAQEFLESTIAPYFYDYIFAELQQLLGEQLAREGNFIVETALTPSMQTIAESSLKSSIQTTGATNGFSQGGLVTLDSNTGEILAMAGGADYKESQFNRVTQAQRQPGSTFKLFTYLAALAQGIPPGQIYSCEPLNWKGQSYQGCERSGGDLDMYRGLALSENVIALRIAQDVGLDRIIDMAKRLGIKSKLDPVPGLVIGQSEVNLLEITGSYSTVANNGLRHSPHAIRRILDSSDCTDFNDINTCRVIYAYDQQNPTIPSVLSASVAETMTTLLQGAVRRGTGQSAYIGLGEAGKTGTTNDNVDLWFIGYLPDSKLATGIWLGNDDNSPTNGSSANAAQLWRDYMSQIAR